METQKNYLFVTIEGGGNVAPVLGIAKQIKNRGHHVRVLTEPCLENSIKNHGLDFVSFTDYFTRSDRSKDIFGDWEAGPFSNPTFDNVIFGPAETVVEQTLREMEAQNTDVLVADCLLFPALMAAEKNGIKSVLLFHMPEYMPGANRPPGVMGLTPGKGPFGKLRDKLLGKIFHKVFNKGLPKLNAVRKKHGLPLLKNAADMIDMADARLIQTSLAFDFPLDPLPKNVSYTGPVLDDPDWTDPWQNPWPANNQKPLVVVSFSSTFQNQGAVVQNCIDALSKLPVRGLVTLGLSLAREKFNASENVKIVGTAPHSQIFPLADLVITHAGHGTLMRALSHGLPLICLPMGRDQNDNAAKVVHHGLGLKLSPKASVEKIANAVLAVLKDPNFRVAAKKMQHHVLTDATSNKGVEILEKLAE